MSKENTGNLTQVLTGFIFMNFEQENKELKKTQCKVTYKIPELKLEIQKHKYMNKNSKMVIKLCQFVLIDLFKLVRPGTGQLPPRTNYSPQNN